MSVAAAGGKAAFHRRKSPDFCRLRRPCRLRLLFDQSGRARADLDRRQSFGYLGHYPGLRERGDSHGVAVRSLEQERGPAVEPAAEIADDADRRQISVDKYADRHVIAVAPFEP